MGEEQCRDRLGGADGRSVRLSPVSILFATLAIATSALALQPPLVRAAPPPTAGLNARSFTQMGNGSSTEADMNREFDLARQAAANVVRLDVIWSWIESWRDARSESDLNQVHLRNLDKIFGAAGRTGVRLLVTLRGTPCWATSTAPRDSTGRCLSGFATYPPDDPRKYGEFAAFLAARYPGRIAGIGVWNEANLPAQFKGTPAQYVALAGAANQAVTDVPIIAGALNTLGEQNYMRALYAVGLRGRFDVWADHAFAGSAQSVIDSVKGTRQVQLESGDTTPIWVDEFGWTTCRKNVLRELTGGYTCSGVSESDQATRLADTFGLLGTLGYVQGAIAFELRNRGADVANPEDNYGIMRRDFSLKPAYESVRTALTR